MWPMRTEFEHQSLRSVLFNTNYKIGHMIFKISRLIDYFAFIFTGQSSFIKKPCQPAVMTISA